MYLCGSSPNSGAAIAGYSQISWNSQESPTNLHVSIEPTCGDRLVWNERRVDLLEHFPGVSGAGSDYSGISITSWVVFSGFRVAGFAEAAASFGLDSAYRHLVENRPDGCPGSRRVSGEYLIFLWDQLRLPRRAVEPMGWRDHGPLQTSA